MSMIARLASTLVALASIAVASSPSSNKPHIIFLMADDMGWGQTSYRGHPVLKTPNLDAMAVAGLRFERFYAGSPVCSPTRATVLTGRSHDRYGTFSHGYALRRQEKTIAQALAKSGYLTAHFGKWHLNGFSGPGVPILATDPYHPGVFGFREWISASNYFDQDPLLSRNGHIEQFRGDSSEVIVAEAITFLRRNHTRGPMFLVIWYGSPHSPWKALPEDLAPFESLDPKSAAHYGELRALDRSVGMLRAALRELGIAQDTLLVFCSDNGGLPGIRPDTVGGLRGYKGELYEGGIRVPGIIEWPGTIQPRVTHFPACTMDLFPTVADLLGLPDDVFVQPLDGISLVPLFQRELPRREKPIPFRFGNRAAWIVDEWKLVMTQPPEGSVELYNLNDDPGEKVDRKKDQPELAQRMTQELQRWLRSVEASLRGHDYPEGRLTQPDPPRRAWKDAPEYQLFIEQWRSRWEYAQFLGGRARETGSASPDALSSERKGSP